MKTNPNDPAFHNPGLTKREYFAAMALQGLLADNTYNTDVAANVAVDFADLLIEALNKR
jgi:hypothetical protein